MSSVAELMDLFERALGRQFRRRPTFRRLGRLSYAWVCARSEGSLKRELYESVRGRRPGIILSAFYRAAAFLAFIIRGEEAPFFDGPTHRIYTRSGNAAEGEECAVVWHELGHALHSEADPAGLRGLNTLFGTDEEFAKAAFSEGFAAYCSDQVAIHSGHEQRYGDAFGEAYRPPLHDRRRVAELIERNRRIHALWKKRGELGRTSFRDFPVEEARELDAEEKRLCGSMWKSFLEVNSNRNKLLELLPLLGCYWVGAVAAALRDRGAGTPEVVSHLLECAPRSFPELFCEAMPACLDPGRGPSTAASSQYLAAHQCAIARHLNHLAGIHHSAGDLHAALDCLERAQAMGQATEERDETARRLSDLGSAYAERDETDRALQCYRLALAMREELHDREGAARLLDMIAVTFHSRGELDRALEYLERGRAIWVELGDRAEIATTVEAIGHLQLGRRDLESALECYRQALAAQQELQDKGAVADLLGYMSDVFADRGELDEALDHLRRALVVVQEMGDRNREAELFNRMGSAHQDLGQLDQALDQLERARTIWEELADKPRMLDVLGSIGFVQHDRHQFDRALECYRRALALGEELADKGAIARILGNMGTVFRDRGDPDLALGHLQRALTLNQEIGHDRAAAADLSRMALIHARSGDLGRATNLLERCVAILGPPGTDAAPDEPTVANLAPAVAILQEAAATRLREQLDCTSALPLLRLCVQVQNALGADGTEAERMLAECQARLDERPAERG